MHEICLVISHIPNVSQSQTVISEDLYTHPGVYLSQPKSIVTFLFHLICMISLYVFILTNHSYNIIKILLRTILGVRSSNLLKSINLEMTDSHISNTLHLYEGVTSTPFSSYPVPQIGATPLPAS